MFQVDGVIGTGCLVSMPNYTENVLASLFKDKHLLLNVQLTWSLCSRNATHYPEVDWQIVWGFFSPGYDTEIMNDGYERCEKKRNVKMNVMMMMRTQHLNLCRCGKKIHNGLKTTCWATKPINIFNVGTLLHFSHFCFYCFPNGRYKAQGSHPIIF